MEANDRTGTGPGATTAAREACEPIARVVGAARVGWSRRHDGLELFGIETGRRDESSAMLLSEALDQGLADAEEIAGGQVPRLMLRNRCLRDVLVLDGDLLCGGRQDRVANATVLVKGQTEAVIPVSCVEQGRWAGGLGSHAFRASPSKTPTSLQRRKAESTARIVLAGAGAAAALPAPDQREVWNSVAGYHADLRSRSKTGAITHAYAACGDEVADYVRAFDGVAREGAADGVVAALHGRVLALDLVESPGLLRRLLPRIVRGHALEALAARRTCPPRRGSPERPPRSPRPAVGRWLRTVAGIRTDAVRVGPSAGGHGLDVRLVGRRIVGSALVCDGRLVALTAFRVSRPEGAPYRAKSTVV